MRAVIWGCGGTAKDFLRKPILSERYGIVCFTDSNPDLWGKKVNDRYPIVSPDQISDFKYDILIICSLYYEQIIEKLDQEKQIDLKKVVSYKELEREICDRIIRKYQDSKDAEIKKEVEAFKEGNLSIFGSFAPMYSFFSEVIRDDMGHPYIWFEDKKMYFPDDYDFQIKEGKEVVPDILYEQKDGSPHQYLPEGHKIDDGAVILDAGVCEGNFALRYVEKASKIYLVEADEKWMKVLEKTFEPFRDKVVFCNKFLSGRTNAKEITTDDLVRGQLDFLKMDIEGSEVYALLGAAETLKRNSVQCAVCAYHRQNDDKYITHLLQSYGYKTTPSKGYVFFSYDECISDTIDLRRGVIYANK